MYGGDISFIFFLAIFGLVMAALLATGALGALVWFCVFHLQVV